MLQGNTSVWVDKESHEWGEQDVNHENCVDNYKTKRPINVIVSHILEIQKAHVEEKDSQEGIWEIFEFNHVGSPNINGYNSHTNHHYSNEEYESKNQCHSL